MIRGRATATATSRVVRAVRVVRVSLAGRVVASSLDARVVVRAIRITSVVAGRVAARTGNPSFH
jgi:hypothetical protein